MIDRQTYISLNVATVKSYCDTLEQYYTLTQGGLDGALGISTFKNRPLLFNIAQVCYEILTELTATATSDQQIASLLAEFTWEFWQTESLTYRRQLWRAAFPMIRRHSRQIDPATLASPRHLTQAVIRDTVTIGRQHYAQLTRRLQATNR